ncbi:MAG TPA: hypothetical protein PLE48_03740 [Thiobacillus sp.]|nr:MAG: hypothetical protein B7Y50_03325 [Hydrogenophilales bacterium 28-61-11]OYZ57254.1 MAG: hypothetical protein B7Y21_08250 [Hydrogenophilales bacterium 16-61-112]OZA50990.1 MAG: hypothetical protein B7X81_00820 [Hydrogenophilales bacterium 17-61-76]HQT30716.1 hypothetical protein [Thiobacillus sp.]HQT69520.1 hypothetical protein [Thiobacillus sp.]
MKRFLIPLALCLTACDASPPPQPQTGRPPNPVFETQIQAVKKAEAVDAQVQAAAEAQRQQMDAATQ